MPGIPLMRWVRHQSPPSLKGAMRHQMALVERCPCLLSFPTLKATDRGKMSKAAPCRISSTFSCLLSWVTVWLWLSSGPSLDSSQTDPPFFFFFFFALWELRFAAFICVAVRRSEPSHDEFTPLCSYPYVCVWSLSRSGWFHAIVTEVEIFDISHMWQRSYSFVSLYGFIVR